MDVKVFFIANSTDPSEKQRKFDLLIEKIVAYLFFFFICEIHPESICASGFRSALLILVSHLRRQTQSKLVQPTGGALSCDLKKNLQQLSWQLFWKFAVFI